MPATKKITRIFMAGYKRLYRTHGYRRASDVPRLSMKFGPFSSESGAAIYETWSMLSWIRRAAPYNESAERSGQFEMTDGPWAFRFLLHASRPYRRCLNDRPP